jgi:hypothetical protein
MANLPDDILYEGVSVDFGFSDPGPTFGDLFLISGGRHPRFPPSGAFAFDALTDLQFEQADDYFGVRSLSDEGDDVPIWLYPLVSSEPVHHHPGPFDAVRLDYNILRNPVRRAEHYFKCVERFAAFAANVFYRSRSVELGVPPDLSRLRADIEAVVRHWASAGIVVGSSEALEIDS